MKIMEFITESSMNSKTTVKNAKINVAAIQTAGEYNVKAQMVIVDGGSKENV